jgi:hypothetical protein
MNILDSSNKIDFPRRFPVKLWEIHSYAILGMWNQIIFIILVRNSQSVADTCPRFSRNFEISGGTSKGWVKKIGGRATSTRQTYI